MAPVQRESNILAVRKGPSLKTYRTAGRLLNQTHTRKMADLHQSMSSSWRINLTLDAVVMSLYHAPLFLIPSAQCTGLSWLPPCCFAAPKGDVLLEHRHIRCVCVCVGPPQKKRLVLFCSPLISFSPPQRGPYIRLMWCFMSLAWDRCISDPTIKT